MKNTATKICIGILIVTFIAIAVGVVFTALNDAVTAGEITAFATVLCAIGWFLAMRNFRLAEEGDFSSEGKQSSVFKKLFGKSMENDITPIGDADTTAEYESL